MHDLLKLCFLEDPLLKEQDPRYFNLNTNKFVEKVLNDSKTTDFYVVYNKGDIIGYFSNDVFQGYPYLDNFFIRYKYRNKKIIGEFWNLVTKDFHKGKLFTTAVYKETTRAIKFYNQNGRFLKKFKAGDGRTGLLFVFNEKE
jgi:hypothetical protein